MDAQKKRMAGKLLVSSLLALAIAGTTTTAAEAATYNKTFTSPNESTYALASSWFPDLRTQCHNQGLGGTVIREYVQDYPNSNPRVMQAFLLCQWQGV